MVNKYLSLRVTASAAAAPENILAQWTKFGLDCQRAVNARFFLFLITLATHALSMHFSVSVYLNVSVYHNLPYHIPHPNFYICC